jgi:hypothetical protein
MSMLMNDSMARRRTLVGNGIPGEMLVEIFWRFEQLKEYPFDALRSAVLKQYMIEHAWWEKRVAELEEENRRLALDHALCSVKKP